MDPALCVISRALDPRHDHLQLLLLCYPAAATPATVKRPPPNIVCESWLSLAGSNQGHFCNQPISTRWWHLRRLHGQSRGGGGWHEAMVAGGRYGVTHDKHVLAFIINSLGTLASRGCAAFLFALGAHGLANNGPADCAAGPVPATDTAWLVNGTGKVPRQTRGNRYLTRDHPPPAPPPPGPLLSTRPWVGGEWGVRVPHYPPTPPRPTHPFPLQGIMA